LEALLMVATGKGQVWALRQWELETINSLGWTEAQWSSLVIEERYRKVIAHKLNGWLGGLEIEEQRRKLRAESGR
jgi:hypothetical protein